MKYRIKWVTEHLGITRKAIRNYEDKGLLRKGTYEDPETKYREFDEDDIKTLWLYKMLQEMGFSVNEIKEAVADGKELSFQNKMEDLEARKKNIEEAMELLRYIKILGGFPDTKHIGSVTYDQMRKGMLEFFEAVPEFNRMKELFTTINEAKEKDRISGTSEEMLESFADRFKEICSTSYPFKQEAYLEALAALSKQADHKDPSVQIIAGLFCKCLLDHVKTVAEVPEHIDEKFLARGQVIIFVEGGDFYEANREKYGEEACSFIAKALSYYAGYESVDECLKYDQTIVE